MRDINGMRDSEFRVQMSHPQGGSREGHTVEIRIEDAASNMEILSFSLSAEQFTAMMGSSYLSSVPGQIVTEDLFGRVGKTFERTDVPVPDAVTKGTYGNEPNETMTEFAAKWLKDNPDWDTVFWSKHNYGWRLNANRYIAKPETEVAE